LTRILLCLSHSIEEYDQLRLLSSLGHEVVSLGGYIDPRHPHDPKRPALDIPYFPEVQTAVDAIGSDDNLGAAQSYIPDAILDWLGDDGVIIYHHYLDRLYGQWERIRDWKLGSPRRRIIWRSVGQSVENNERQAAPYRAEGLERVAYSPREAAIPGYTGHDALIRFYKDPDDYGGWTGEGQYVLGFGQHFVQRDRWTNYPWFASATEGLPVRLVGPGSEEYDGTGEVSFERLRQELRLARVYCYTGTQPASYTLGLIEAMMTGTPIVSIGPRWFDIFAPYGPEMFEGLDIVGVGGDDPHAARDILTLYLNNPDAAVLNGIAMRRRAVELFGMDTIREQWADFLR
jgi:glycosyltransferase involved in cell wall biosynthesis